MSLFVFVFVAVTKNKEHVNMAPQNSLYGSLSAIAEAEGFLKNIKPGQAVVHVLSVLLTYILLCHMLNLTESIQ